MINSAKKYKMIRGPIQKARCTAGGTRLYCDCGCQEPRLSDPDLDLAGVTVSGWATHGYANFSLIRGGTQCGEYNSQYGALVLDDHEYLGVDRGLLSDLHAAAMAIIARPSSGAGDTIEENAAWERMGDKIDQDEMDERHKNHPGYCNKCHTYCHGDCQS